MRLLPAFLVSSVLFALPASAQATRTWVSGVGDDVNPCSRTAPCKTFAGAISKTAAGGEIDALDPGGFGAVTITKAITIDVRNTLGGVLVGATNGIVVQAAAADVVVLRGLDLFGVTGALSGVRFVSGKALHVEDSTIANFTTGISFEATTAAPQLFVKNTTITNCSTAGISLTGGVATLDKVTLTNSAKGLVTTLAAKATLHGANVSGHAQHGVHAQGTSQVSIERSVIAANTVGVLGETGTTVRLSDTMLSHNTTGLSGDVTSFGNNRVAAGNATDGAPTTTVLQQ